MRYDVRISLLAVLLILAISLGCGGTSNSPGKSPQLVTDVYATGAQADNTTGTPWAVYWKNGAPISLAPSSANPIAYSEASSIAVSGSDVYVAGFQGTNNRFSAAMLWKNGAPIPLSDGTNLAIANAVAVSDTDVYVAGYQSSTLTGPTQAGYWKNGVFTALPDRGEGAQASGIFVSGPDIYVAGVRNQTTRLDSTHLLEGQVAQYWKNGVPVDLTDATNFAYGTSIFVDGSDVYVGGAQCPADGSPCIGYYWKNGSPVAATTQPYSQVTSVSVSGTSVYASVNQPNSNHLNQGLLLKDATLSPLSGEPAGNVNQIATIGNDVYVAGKIAATSSTLDVAAVWKNGTLTPLTNGTHNAYATGVAVVQHY